jgi:hypothetical protein
MLCFLCYGDGCSIARVSGWPVAATVPAGSRTERGRAPAAEAPVPGPNLPLPVFHFFLIFFFVFAVDHSPLVRFTVLEQSNF